MIPSHSTDQSQSLRGTFVKDDPMRDHHRLTPEKASIVINTRPDAAAHRRAVVLTQRLVRGY